MPAPARLPSPLRPLPANRLGEPKAGSRVTVAGLVLVRQRPGTAKGVIFLTLEDETGTANVVVWAQVYERFRRAVIAGRLLRAVQHCAAGCVAAEQRALRSLQDLDHLQVEEGSGGGAADQHLVEIGEHCRRGIGEGIDRLAAQRVVELVG